jgi:hypothetical protein
MAQPGDDHRFVIEAAGARLYYAGELVGAGLRDARRISISEGRRA